MTVAQLLIALTLAILGVIAPYAWPKVVSKSVSYPIAIFALLVLGCSVMVEMFRPKSSLVTNPIMIFLLGVMVIVGWRIWQSRLYVPMEEAATRAYETLRKGGSNWARIADWFAENGLGQTLTTGILIYIADAFVTNSVPIYGKHPPSRIYERIDPQEFKKGIFRDNGATFFYHNTNDARYIDISIKRTDLKKEIKRMNTPRYAR